MILCGEPPEGKCRAMARPGSRRNPKRTVPRSEYATYIKSPEWQAQRLRYWQSKLAKCCYTCGLPWLKFVQGMHLHHRAYWNLGNERLIDLQPLCASCHADVHKLVADGRRSLWKAGRLLKRINLFHGRYHTASLQAGERAHWTPANMSGMKRRREWARLP